MFFRGCASVKKKKKKKKRKDSIAMGNVLPFHRRMQLEPLSL